MAAIALPDSINPSLIFADLYLAAGQHPGRRTAVFAVTVFAVTFVGGVLIALGLAELVRSSVPRLSHGVKYGLVVAGGVTLGLGGMAIWFNRQSLAARRSPKEKHTRRQGQSAVLMGAGIAGIELLTAFPYFAAISIIVGSGASLPGVAFLLGLYSLVYVLPLIGIAIVCAMVGPRAAGILDPIKDRLLTRWPIVVAPLAVALGVGLTAFGVLRLVGN
ncbi:MAG TPA: GAP family protein [Solirubrobacterales bacterium]